jgi:hypothetical protein
LEEESIMTSQINQDKFVIDTFKNKTNGTFIDIGAGHPIEINNTYILEKDFEWTGISFDIGPPYTHGCNHMSINEYKELWKNNRKTKLYTCDCRTLDFLDIFDQNNMPKTIDYLSMDLEPPEVTFEVLKKLPFDKYVFNAITFEHDNYRGTNTLSPSREFLSSLGYVLVQSVNNQEDWYVYKN